MKVAYLGPAGSFSEKAALSSFPNGELTPIQTIRNVIESVESGKVEYGVVPLENFYNGIVMQTIDTLTEVKKTRIVSESYLRIEHCIGALSNHKEILKIISHPQALEQCSRYISLKYPGAETINSESTSKAAQLVKEGKMSDAAAIASKIALENNGLKILDNDILPNNITRFAIVSLLTEKESKKSKTLISIHPNIDKSGILYNILKFISDAKINMRHIHSRPDGKGKYYFVLEIDGHQNDKNMIGALRGIKSYLEDNESVKVLGSYTDRGEHDN